MCACVQVWGVSSICNEKIPGEEGPLSPTPPPSYFLQDARVRRGGFAQCRVLLHSLKEQGAGVKGSSFEAPDSPKRHQAFPRKCLLMVADSY